MNINKTIQDQAVQRVAAQVSRQSSGTKRVYTVVNGVVTLVS